MRRFLCNACSKDITDRKTAAVFTVRYGHTNGDGYHLMVKFGLEEHNPEFQHACSGECVATIVGRLLKSDYESAKKG